MSTSNLPQATGQQAIATLPTLRRGNSGDATGILQQMLNFKGFPVKVDRIFGQRTEQAVKDFQRTHNLVIDGVVATQTWHQLSLESEYSEVY
jgi:peptidoglycan hydrolase-like protein with peptidoglycan-binding domain